MVNDDIIQRSLFLSVIPRSYLLGIIKKKKLTPSKINSILSKVLSKEFDNPRSKLEKLANYELTEFFIKGKILTKEEEKELYFQFRDSYNPIFYLFKYKIHPFEDPKKLMLYIETQMKPMILNLSTKFANKETFSKEPDILPKYKNFQLKKTDIFKDSIIEFKFEYLEKLNYLDRNYTPKFVYSLKFGLFWIDISNKLIIIKCPSKKIVFALREYFSIQFDTTIWKFNLTKSFVDKVFNFSEIVKISLSARSEVDPLSLDSIIIKDKSYAEKLADPVYEFLKSYERKFGSYNTKIEGFNRKIKINVSEVGKISLIGSSIKLDKAREWLIETLIDLMKIQDEYLSNQDYSSFIKTNDYIKQTKIYKKISSNKAREKFSDLIEKVIILKQNPSLENVELLMSREEAYYFKDYLIKAPNLRCNEMDCNAILECPNLECDSSNFKVIKAPDKNQLCIKCTNCNYILDEDVEIKCIDNHAKVVDYDDLISYIFSLNLKREINHIFKELELGFEINSDLEVFYVKENKLYRIENNSKILYKWNELPSFREIPQLEELDDFVKETQTHQITQILEKCNDYKGLCRNCEVTDDPEKLCISKIFVFLAKGSVHPHSGFEYGDFSIEQKFSDRIERIYGIVKSHKETPKNSLELIFGTKFGKLLLKSNDNLLEQLIEACMDESIRFIMIVSGRIIGDQLRNYIIEIVRWKKKKLVIIEPKELIPILSHFSLNFEEYNKYINR